MAEAECEEVGEEIGEDVGSYLLQRQRELKTMSIGTILLIILVIVLLGGFSGFGGGLCHGTAVPV